MEGKEHGENLKEEKRRVAFLRCCNRVFTSSFLVLPAFLLLSQFLSLIFKAHAEHSQISNLRSPKTVCRRVISSLSGKLGVRKYEKEDREEHERYMLVVTMTAMLVTRTEGRSFL